MPLNKEILLDTAVQFEWTPQDSSKFQLVYRDYMVQLRCKPKPEDENCEEVGSVPEDDPCSLGVATDCDGNRFSF